jgi:hypothetical protein
VRTTIFAARAREQAETQGRDLVRAVGDDVTSRILQAAFRGCAFLNAVSEFEAPQSLSAWSSPSTASGITSSSVEPSKTPATNFPPNAVRHFVTLRDGAMSAAYLDTPNTAIRTFARGVDRLIRTIDTFP